jgi:hypothetical protein
MATRTFIVLSVGSVAMLAAAAFAWEPSPARAGPQLPSSTDAPISGVSFQDPGDELVLPALSFGTRDDAPLRFGEATAPDGTDATINDNDRRYELALTAPGRVTGLGVDVGVAPRASFGVDDDGRLTRAGAGAEVRVGQGLESLVDPWEPPSWDAPAWYFFAASDGQALAWSPERAANVPGARGDGLRLQNRVEVGDFQAGVSVEAGGMQASLSYVQRDVSGPHGSHEENFTGVTLSMGR